MISRRCLICANINPCREHSEQEQEAELARNDAAIARIRRAEGKRCPTPLSECECDNGQCALGYRGEP
jgi:hypothetical protein